MPPITTTMASFDKTPTPAIVVFELLVIAAAGATWLVLSRKTPRITLHFLAIAVGALIFEVFTAPMWNNLKLGPWAYVYHDVSWVLTLGWATMVLITVFLVDRLLPHRSEWQRFLLYLLILTPVTLLAEALVIGLGIRSYAPEVQTVIGDAWLPVLNVPAAGLYYVPVFMTLTISFYKYWLPIIEQRSLPEAHSTLLLRRFVLGFIGVFFFEVMIEPMVENRGFPAWSYLFHDITFLMTLLWVVVLALGTAAVDLVFKAADPRLRFAAYLVVVGAIATPIEAWFINAGLRVYGPSATANFSGFRAIVGNIPIEVALGIPLYLALVVSFVHYWERIGSYRSGFNHQPEAPRRSLHTRPAHGLG